MALAWAAFAAATLYFFMMARVARAAERGRLRVLTGRLRPAVYALSLGVYSTCWTLYGAPGAAAAGGFAYAAGYLGPVVAFTLGFPILRKIAAITARENITSIADFLASRYGKSRGLAAVVTTAAIIGVVPYCALQLRAADIGADALAQAGGAPGAPAGVTLAAAVLLAGLAMALGGRGPRPAARERGLVAFAAVDTLFMTVVMVGVALFLLWGAPQPRAVTPGGGVSVAGLRPGDMMILGLCGMLAVFCLPRQFHMTFLQTPTRQDQNWARVLFPAYLLVLAVAAAIIGRAGLPLAGGTPDALIIAAPVAAGAPWLGVLAFVAGLSAAVAMAAASASALSTMAINDLMLPALLRTKLFEGLSALQMDRVLTVARRVVIVALWAAAWAYLTYVPDQPLAVMGLLAITAAAQLAPALWGGLYWRGGRASGAKAGIVIGLLVWAYTLLLPVLMGADTLAASGLQKAWGGVLDPSALFGVTGISPMAHGAAWSLGVNVLVYILVSVLSRSPLRERVQAAVFVGGAAPSRLDQAAGVGGQATTGDLMTLAERFVGGRAARAAFDRFERRTGRQLHPAAHPEVAVVRFVERQLAGVLGASSARVIVASALSGGVLRTEQTLALIDQAAHEVEFNRDLVRATMENISQGVSVVDKNLKLVAWNQPYVDMFEYPVGFLYPGQPIAEVIRYNAERGEFGPGDVDAKVAKRVGHLRVGTRHAFERVRPNGMVLKTFGNPMPGGGYVTTFTDVTEDRWRAQAIAEAKDRLEDRVAERTEELEALARELEAAKRAAEDANAGKTAFLAAASHDLLQPLNAARLFAGALISDLGGAAPERRAMAENIERSISSADRLLRALLDISRLDQGGIRPKLSAVPLEAVFGELETEFAPMAEQQGLRLVRPATSLNVRSDRTLLRSVVQNLLSNALRYTKDGGVILGARRIGRGRVRVEVIDTGPGIPPERQEEIFQEFRRLQDVDVRGEHGAGLGLAIVDRIARLLGAPVHVRSQVGCGSTFSITLPRARAAQPAQAAAPLSRNEASLAGMRVLFVDDEANIRSAMATILEGWGCAPQVFSNADGAIAAAQDGEAYAAVLADFHLGPGADGLSVLDAFAARTLALRPRRFALLTADQSPQLERIARARGYGLIRKPVDPAALREFLSRQPAATDA